MFRCQDFLKKPCWIMPRNAIKLDKVKFAYLCTWFGFNWRKIIIRRGNCNLTDNAHCKLSIIRDEIWRARSRCVAEVKRLTNLPIMKIYFLRFAVTLFRLWKHPWRRDAMKNSLEKRRGDLCAHRGVAITHVTSIKLTHDPFNLITIRQNSK